MEIVAMPFIFIYHIVRYILLTPKRILSYAYSGVLATVDKLSRGRTSEKREAKTKAKENDDSAIREVEALMAEQNISSERKIKLNKEPSISFRYKIKGSQNAHKNY